MANVTQAFKIPQAFCLDLEVDSVPREKGDPLPCITQIAVRCLNNSEKRDFVAYIKPPKELRRKREEPNFEPGNVEPPKKTFKKVWPYLKQWVASHLDQEQKAIFFMHNGYDHDWPILNKELARFGEGIPHHWRPFCTLYLSNALHIEGDRSLSGLCHKFSIPIGKPHEAHEDVKMLEQVLNKLTENANRSDVLRATLDDHPIKAVVTALRTQAVAGVLWVFFDFETTGLFPKAGTGGQNPRVVELAGYIPDTDSSFETKINPEMPIPPESTRIHGIGDGAVAQAPTFKRAITQFEEWIESEAKRTGKKIVCLAGHNIWGYDLKVYRSECERVGHPKLRVQSWKSFDTLYLSRTLFAGHKIPNHKLQTLREIFHVAEDNAHSAGGDVRVNYKVFKHMVEGVPEGKISESLFAVRPVLALKANIEIYGRFKPFDVAIPAPAESTSQVVTRKSGKRVYDEFEGGKEEIPSLPSLELIKKPRVDQHEYVKKEVVTETGSHEEEWDDVFEINKT